jgi:arylsulfatase A-like enzyme
MEKRMKTIPTRRDFLKTLGRGAVVVPFLNPLACVTESSQRPNIILIMSDDMGFSDIGCYGGEINTPNLDQLATNGLRFTQFYNTSRCCPTRASLMTGLYPHQAGIGHMVDANHQLDAYNGDLNNKCLTIAEVLKLSGYSTYMAGKWHVTPYVKPEGPKHNWPRQRGFDRFFGTIHGAGSFYDPSTLTEENTQIPPGEDFYYTDAISDRTVNYIKQHNQDNPFFIYVAYTAAHWPMHALPEDINKYKGRYDSGWDVLRQERYERMIKMGLIDETWSMSERDPDVPPWKDEKMKEWRSRCMEVYAAMVDNMDQGIGRIVNTLKQKGQLDNTLILFLQDNGACAEDIGLDELYDAKRYDQMEKKPMQPGELQDRMIPRYTRDGQPMRRGNGLMPGSANTYISYDINWANASNTPFKLYKHWSHEGGIATPLIVHWPKGIRSKGELRQQPGHLIDIMATCVDAAAANYPEEFNGNKIIPLEGRSLIPAFTNKSIDREALFWEHEGNRALRIGKWKLVARVGRNLRYTESDKNKWELYDLEADRTETQNLAALHPQRVQEMAVLWEQWAKRLHVLPWPWGEF